MHGPVWVGGVEPPQRIAGGLQPLGLAFAQHPHAPEAPPALQRGPKRRRPPRVSPGGLRRRPADVGLRRSGFSLSAMGPPGARDRIEPMTLGEIRLTAREAGRLDPRRGPELALHLAVRIPVPAGHRRLPVTDYLILSDVSVKSKFQSPVRFLFSRPGPGAVKENRTPVSSLGGLRSTTELPPQPLRHCIAPVASHF